MDEIDTMKYINKKINKVLIYCETVEKKVDKLTEKLTALETKFKEYKAKHYKNYHRP